MEIPEPEGAPPKKGNRKERSIYIGVRKKSSHRWGAQIMHDHKYFWLGTFDTVEIAAAAYDDAALRLRGSAARLNFPEYASYEVDVDPPLLNAHSATDDEKDGSDSLSGSKTRTYHREVQQKVSNKLHVTGIAQAHDPNKRTKVRVGNFPERSSCVTSHEAVQHVSHSTGNEARRKYRGVQQVSAGKWGARIYDSENRKDIGLGRFNTAEEAARAYDDAALRLRGSRARLNFPEYASYEVGVDPPLLNANSAIDEKDGSDSSSGSKTRTYYRELQQKVLNKLHVSGIAQAHNPNKRSKVRVGNFPELSSCVISQEAVQHVSHSTGNEVRRKYRGVQQVSASKWGSRIYDSENRKDIGLGRFNTAEEAARAYDEAAMKKQYRNGQKARLNFPDWEADSHVSNTDSVEFVSCGEDSPSKRNRDSQSPGSALTLLSHDEGRNHQSSGVSHSGLEEGIVAQPDSSFQQIPGEDHVFSGSWCYRSELDTYLKRDRAISSVIAALNETVQRTFSVRAPCLTEF